MDTKTILTQRTNNFPAFVEFQINSLCNSNCIICPYESMAKKFPKEVMRDELIDKIVDELDRHKESIKRVIPYLNNEPSLDNRMLSVLRKLKQSNHFIELSTNMSGITKEKADAIVKEKLVDELRISFFGGSLSVYQKMMPGLKYYDIVSKIQYLIEENRRNNNPIDIKIVVVLYPELDMEENIALIKKIFPGIEIYTFGFLDRANNVNKTCNKKLINERTDEQYILQGCDLNRPFERICILSNGKVVFCSQDWDREVELGNVAIQSIFDIWNGELFEAERERLVGTKGSPRNYLCRRCKLVHLKHITSGKLFMNFLGDKYIDENDILRQEIL